MAARRRRRARAARARTHAPGASPSSSTQTPTRAASQQRAGAGRPARAARERPRAPWHPLPLSEILIVVGGIAIAIGLVSGGPAQAAPAILAGVGAVLLGTFEVTLREHLAGFRSHAALLALLAVVVFHTAAVFIVSAFASFPRQANIALFAIDLALFLFLFRLLRSRYIDAKSRSS